MQMFVYALTVFALAESSLALWQRHGEFEYYIERSRQLNFKEASIACEKMNGTLAKVNTNEIQVFLAKQLNSTKGNTQTYYIGLQNTDGKFKWWDGTLLNDTKWTPGEEINFILFNEYCGAMENGPDYLWVDIKCNRNEGFICQRKIDEATTTTAVSSTTQRSLNLLTSTSYDGFDVSKDQNKSDFGTNITTNIGTVTQTYSTVDTTLEAGKAAQHQTTILAASICGVVLLCCAMIVIAVLCIRKSRKRSTSSAKSELDNTNEDPTKTGLRINLEGQVVYSGIPKVPVETNGEKEIVTNPLYEKFKNDPAKTSKEMVANPLYDQFKNGQAEISNEMVANPLYDKFKKDQAEISNEMV